MSLQDLSGPACATKPGFHGGLSPAFHSLTSWFLGLPLIHLSGCLGTDPIPMPRLEYTLAARFKHAAKAPFGDEKSNIVAGPPHFFGNHH